LAGLCVYQTDNQRLRNGPSPDIVFLGDSITQAWTRIDPAFFGTRRVGRGISGQTSAQMLLRFRQDAIALRPKVIHLLAGTNDVAGNVGAMGGESYKSNVIAMADLARANGITLVLGAIPPADRFPWRASVEPVGQIRALNNWLRDFASQRGIIFVDYHTALATPSGAARDGLTRDGVHPNAAGYGVMAEVAEPALAMAMAMTPDRRAAPAQ
jgi:lysophospholipase L1-like esterase